jgi:hypothetical protein
MPHPRNADGDRPTQLDGQNATEVAADPVLTVKTAGGSKSAMQLFFGERGRSGTLLGIRPAPGPRPELFLMRTADRPDEYLVKIDDPEMAQKIPATWRLSDPSQAYGAHLARSLQRQQEEARRRLTGGPGKGGNEGTQLGAEETPV